MTSRQYQRIEKFLEQAEDVTSEHPLLTAEGRNIQAQIRQLLIKVAAEQIRAADRVSTSVPKQD
jgi:hypothetical protein